RQRGRHNLLRHGGYFLRTSDRIPVVWTLAAALLRFGVCGVAGAQRPDERPERRERGVGGAPVTRRRRTRPALVVALIVGASGCLGRGGGEAALAPVETSSFDSSRGYTSQRPEWYGTDEAVQVATNLVGHQQASGGWPLMENTVQSIIVSM